VEAIIGAVFLEGGYEPAQALLERFFGEIIQATDAESWSKDAKTELQEWLQARKIPVPAYCITATRGEKHAQTFEVECAVATLGLAETGEGRSRRTAEQEAARRMLDALEASDRPGGRCVHEGSH
jgi:ribonuclease-3